MRMLYLTNVKIPAKDAQNLQIQAMSRAFNSALGEDFLLISPWNNENRNFKNDYAWIKIKIPKFLPRFLRQGAFIIKTFLKVIRFKPSHIFTRDIAIAFFYKIFGFQTVYEIHKPFETKIGAILFRIISKKIKIVAISQALKDFVVEKYGLSSDGILVAHDGVFLEDFEKVKDSKEFLKKKYLNLNKDSFVALYSGSLQKGKGSELILEAAKQLPEIHFVIIGNGDFFEKNKLSNLIFIGHQKQSAIPYYLKSADLLLLPNTKELNYHQFTSPLKLFEYMASGVPIASSSSSSINEILNVHNSFLFNIGDIDDFVAKILYVKNNIEVALIRANQSLQDIENYDWLKRAQKIIDFVSL